MLDVIQGMALGCLLLLHSYVPEHWQWLTSDIMTTVPALFWLLCQLAFAHKPKFKSVWTFIALYSFLAPAIARPFGGSWPDAEPLHLFGWLLPSYCEYLLTLHGLWVVAANWQDDLVESRRQMRGIVIGGVGVAVMVIIVSMNTGLGARLPLALVVLACAVVTAYFLLHGQVGALLGATPPVSAELVTPTPP